MAITYPVPASTFPSAEWWADLAASTQASIDAAQNAAVSTAAANTSSAVASAQAALQAAIDGKAPAVHTHTRAQVSDATTLGRTLMGVTDGAAARAAIGVPELAVGTDLGTADLDTIVMPGTYRQANGPSATYARHYPVEGCLGTLEVRVVSSPNYIEQTFTRLTAVAEGTRSTQWRRIRWAGIWREWERLPDLYTHLPSSVDTTVGTRVFIAGQMVYGDTGTRAMPELATPLGYTIENLRILLRRVGTVVYFDIDGRLPSGTPTTQVDFAPLPVGFRFSSRPSGPIVSVSQFTQLGVITGAWSLVTWRPSTGSGHLFRASLTGLTSDPWPTTLPGTPA